ncbi:RipA family octameric membrane protein [Nocardia concava]|uniref:RipA family octameric membrane protein n=1 Tax=Nocardia concava TaxID=257281 RepID=UPI001FE1C0EB|nr:hypothetical protein [Nocardia concava]
MAIRRKFGGERGGLGILPMMRRMWLHHYFGTGLQPSVDEVRADLWTNLPGMQADSEAWRAVLLEQYRTYVEMADRISARRGIANTFFLTINTAVASVAATVWQTHSAAAGFASFLLAVMLVQCLAWYWILRSYRQLNAAKYAVIGAMEERLPASPYWRAEWRALGSGKDPDRYWPLAHVEQWIPALFAVIYLVGFLCLVFN